MDGDVAVLCCAASLFTVTLVMTGNEGNVLMMAAQRCSAMVRHLQEGSTRYTPSVKGARGQSAAVATHDCDSQLPNVTVPTLIQHGTADATVLFSNGLRLHELIPNSKLSVFEDAGHA